MVRITTGLNTCSIAQMMTPAPLTGFQGAHDDEGRKGDVQPPGQPPGEHAHQRVDGDDVDHKAVAAPGGHHVPVGDAGAGGPRQAARVERLRQRQESVNGCIALGNSIAGQVSDPRAWQSLNSRSLCRLPCEGLPISPGSAAAVECTCTFAFDVRKGRSHTSKYTILANGVGKLHIIACTA